MKTLKDGNLGRRVRLAMLAYLHPDREGRDIIAWHQQRPRQPGEPSFAARHTAMARRGHRGTIKGKTIAEHARAYLQLSVTGMLRWQYLARFGRHNQARIVNAANDLLLEVHPAKQVLAGWHGNGHLLRQRSLQMDGWQYAEVVNKVQQIQGRT